MVYPVARIPNLAHCNIRGMHCVLLPVAVSLARGIIDSHAFQIFAVSRPSMSWNDRSDWVAMRPRVHSEYVWCACEHCTTVSVELHPTRYLPYFESRRSYYATDLGISSPFISYANMTSPKGSTALSNGKEQQYWLPT